MASLALSQQIKPLISGGMGVNMASVDTLLVYSEWSNYKMKYHTGNGLMSTVEKYLYRYWSRLLCWLFLLLFREMGDLEL